ncbi:MAG: guanine deaminase [Syntrophales bacterium]|nr:guanine deaminase [Syntrophales bacterium]MDD5643793.1 guanine deaminase [Syntrophales bacterium]
MKAYRAAIFHLVDNPVRTPNPAAAYQYWEDGLLLVEKGKIKAAGPAAALLPQLPEGVPVASYQNALIIPGLIDIHIHFPQITTVASYGEQLLEWLHDYILPGEGEYADQSLAQARAEIFLKELLRRGTTTASVYCSLAKESAEALFTVAQRLNLRLLAGKVMMDRNGPEGMKLATPEADYHDCQELIEKWHGKGRLAYVVTPRFAPACSEVDLQAAARLLKEYPGLYVQTHLCENHHEIAWVRELFPERKSYLDVYDHYGLVGEKTLLGHSLHLEDEDFRRVREAGAVLCPCPPSNFFLGRGLFKFAKAREYQAKVALGTDLGAGNTFSMFKAMEEAYKMAQLQGYSLSPFEAFYLVTLGGARALSLEDKIGNFEVGKEADFLILDLQSTPFLKFRMQFARTLCDQLFVQMMLGDDRAIRETYVYGVLAHRRDT